MLAYDVGMNNGDDTRYYLQKGYDVIAIEANPVLCSAVAESLKEFVDSGRLKILNVAVAEEEGSIEFNIDLQNDVRSSIKVVPGREVRTVSVKARRISNIIREYGMPDFIKIDVEHVDEVLLLDMIKAGIKPGLISVEGHSFEIIMLLWQMGYREFRLVNGKTVHLEFRKVEVRAVDGSTFKYSFPRHSAGPFGDDLPGRWNSVQHAASEWLHRHALFGSGWFDVHAR